MLGSLLCFAEKDGWCSSVPDEHLCRAFAWTLRSPVDTRSSDRNYLNFRGNWASWDDSFVSDFFPQLSLWCCVECRRAPPAALEVHSQLGISRADVCSRLLSRIRRVSRPAASARACRDCRDRSCAVRERQETGASLGSMGSSVAQGLVCVLILRFLKSY